MSAPLSTLLTHFQAFLAPAAIDLLEIEKLPVFREPDGDPTIRHESRTRHVAATREGQLTYRAFGFDARTQTGQSAGVPSVARESVCTELDFQLYFADVWSLILVINGEPGLKVSSMTNKLNRRWYGLKPQNVRTRI